MTTIRDKAKKKRGDPPLKMCPACFACLPAAVRQCEFCGHDFPRRATKAERKEAADVMARWSEAEKERQMDWETMAALEDLEAEVRKINDER